MPVRIITSSDVAEIVRIEGLTQFIDLLIARLEEAFRKWRELTGVPRVSFSYPNGVMEVMPASDQRWYAVKIVNGHPGNPKRGLMTVTAVAVLADVETGYPVMVADATLLTAFRTGAASAVATKYLARRGSRVLGIIGTGAQSEFLCLAISRVAPIERIVYFDIDMRAAEKFRRNLDGFGFELVAASSSREVAEKAEILVTATAAKGRQQVVRREWLNSGVHINAVGGDAPGKTELDSEILRGAKVVVELLDQALIEGEVQNVGREFVYAELWEIVSGLKPGRIHENEITVFDSVGVAVEDWAALTLLYELSLKRDAGRTFELLPLVTNPKDLFFVLKKSMIC